MGFHGYVYSGIYYIANNKKLVYMIVYVWIKVQQKTPVLQAVSKGSVIAFACVMEYTMLYSDFCRSRPSKHHPKK